jgi:hypothetical protein
VLNYCCNYFEHILQRLFALRAWTEWLGTSCWFCLKGEEHSFLPLWWAGLCNRGRLRLLLAPPHQNHAVFSILIRQGPHRKRPSQQSLLSLRALPLPRILG